MPKMSFNKMSGAMPAASSTKAEAETVSHIEKGIKQSMAQMKPLGGETGTAPNTNPIEIEELRSPVAGKWTKGPNAKRHSKTKTSYKPKAAPKKSKGKKK